MIGINFFIENDHLNIINIFGLKELHEQFNVFSKTEILDYISFIKENKLGQAKEANNLYIKIKEKTKSVTDTLSYKDFSLDKIPVEINKISIRDSEFRINKILTC
jgi:hypothetical protein